MECSQLDLQTFQVAIVPTCEEWDIFAILVGNFQSSLCLIFWKHCNYHVCSTAASNRCKLTLAHSGVFIRRLGELKVNLPSATSCKRPRFQGCFCSFYFYVWCFHTYQIIPALLWGREHLSSMESGIRLPGFELLGDHPSWFSQDWRVLLGMQDFSKDTSRQIETVGL